ncbi:ABC transporter ATP-binding protein [Bradyrhizobium sp. dw_411]|uniref:ABC transporter ATP-binding protein n=1 Tax=Bradyrhizobium sp. dw_411 TaxID=2720082 RepID=UPI001BCD87EF|nr:ABC transporter ATP-binding protein [Bradyrhizobium sp. dw_411]
MSAQPEMSVAVNAVLSVNNLSKSFGGLRATNDVTFDVAPHQVTAMIGPNGAGKTTVFNLITNLLSKDRGQVLFLGRDLAGLSAVKIADMGLIRTFQSARVFPGMTAIENVMVGCHRLALHSGASQTLWLSSARSEERRMLRRAEEMLELVGLAPFKDTHATELPMGAQKLLEVVRALMAQPKLLCLDEPAAGLNDTETQELASLLRAIRTLGIPVLIVEHNMSLVMNVADQVVVIDSGAIIAKGTPAEIQGNKQVIEAYLGRENHAAS